MMLVLEALDGMTVLMSNCIAAACNKGSCKVRTGLAQSRNNRYHFHRYCDDRLNNGRYRHLPQQQEAQTIPLHNCIAQQSSCSLVLVSTNSLPNRNTAFGQDLPVVDLSPIVQTRPFWCPKWTDCTNVLSPTILPRSSLTPQ